ncbi:E3 ubiquitin-protein ligase LRSAM1 [Aphelenchoides besseyi]|nr:E3 ubiquitin-protein ligase LRSAM1 [Aphelenchoides besseyi]
MAKCKHVAGLDETLSWFISEPANIWAQENHIKKLKVQSLESCPQTFFYVTVKTTGFPLAEVWLSTIGEKINNLRFSLWMENSLGEVHGSKDDVIELDKKLWLQPWFYGTGNFYANIRCKVVSTKCKVCSIMSDHKLLSMNPIEQLQVLLEEIESQKMSLNHKKLTTEISESISKCRDYMNHLNEQNANLTSKIEDYKEKLTQIEETNVLLKSQMESIQKMQCVICYERSETVFVPCGHLCCPTCYDKLPLGKSCPSCRRSIQQFQRIYIQ